MILPPSQSATFRAFDDLTRPSRAPLPSVIWNVFIDAFSFNVYAALPLVVCIEYTLTG